ncbi:YncE family protein [Nocardia asiatica]|uniref:YncE family protein n=1 Tax=Nocardia asiatica TaxID=209252 RepID=UPI0024542B3B|nr:hypothetical protein [Nocardia asiatica]
MADVLARLRLTETVVAALRLASSRRPDGQSLDTQTLLLALKSVDSSSNWGRFHISDQPVPDAAGSSEDMWERVPLTRQCADALTRVRVISEAFHLLPVPPGVLALALVWDVGSGAARSVVAMTHHELVLEIQRELLGVELENMSDVLAAPIGSPPDSRPLSAVRDSSELASTEPARLATEAGLKRALAPVVPRSLPTWLLRLAMVAALAGIVVGLATSSAWNFRAHDDLTPPLTRPVIADSIPDDSTISRLLGTEFVRIADGLPTGTKLFDSSVPFWYDVRYSMLDSAWSAQWDSSDGRSMALVEIVRSKMSRPIEMGTHDCWPSHPGDTLITAPVVRAGYVTRDVRGAIYCSSAFYRSTKIYIEVQSTDPLVASEVEARVGGVQQAILHALPTPDLSPVTKIHMSYSAALLNRGLLLATLALPLLWTLPTLLFDRATWQRLAWVLSLRRFRAQARIGWDIDRMVRGRLWAASALACTQICAAIWVVRATSGWRALPTAIAIVAVVLSISAIPRLLYLRKAGRSQVFAGRRQVFWLVGTIVGVLSVSAIAVVAWAGNTFLVFGGPLDMPDYMAQRFGIVIALAAVPAALLAIGPIMLLRRFSMRILRDQRTVDTRSPILLLRSFADDDRRLRARSSHRRGLVDRLSMRKWERFEEIIAASLGTYGPVFAAGQIGERLPPPLGAIRRQFTNEEWSIRVQELMTGASIICVVVGRSNALAWEIQRIAQMGFLHKTIFALPPTSREEHVKRLAVLANFLRLDWKELDVTASGGRALAVWVPTVGGRPEVIYARAQEDVGYDIALETARLKVAGFDWRTKPSTECVKHPAPLPEIYAPGETPVFKSIFRRSRVWVLILANLSVIVGAFVTFLSGEAFDSNNHIQLNNKYRWTAVAADPVASDLFGVMNGTVLARLDFERQLPAAVCSIETATNIVAQSGWLYASNPVTGTVQAIDLAQSRIAWTLRDLPGVRGVVATDQTVYFVLPAGREIRAVDRQSGATTDSRKVDAIPWASALNGDSLFVSFINASSVIEFDRHSLAKSTQAATGIDAIQLVSASGTVWSYSTSAHAVVAISGPSRGAVILTRSQRPHIASNGSVLAIEGIEQASTVWPDGVLHRALMSVRHANGIAVTKAGDVLVMTRDDVVLIRMSGK